MSNPIPEAIGLLLVDAHDWRLRAMAARMSGATDVSAQMNMALEREKAAAALGRIFTDPPTEEVERLADEFRENRIAKNEFGRWRVDTDNGIRAVLRALGEQT